MSTAITVRRAGPGDLAAVVACLVEAFEPFRAAYTRAAFEDTVPTVDGMRQRLLEMTILVAEAGPGEIVGTIAHQVVRAGEGYLRGMAVLPGHQGHGVAERLLLAAEAELRASGCARVTLDTMEPLERAIRFYRRNGYAATGVVTDFFGMRLHVYAKELESVKEPNVQQAVPFFRVADMEASHRFYIRGLGFEMTKKWVVDGRVRWCWLENGGAALMLQEFPRTGHDSWTPEGKVGVGVSICFTCRDALAIYREALARGLAPSRPFVGNRMWVTSLTDPDGYRIEFESPTDVPDETTYPDAPADR